MAISNLLRLSALGASCGSAIGSFPNKEAPNIEQRLNTAVSVNMIAHVLSKSPLLESSLQSVAEFWGSFFGFFVLMGASWPDESSDFIKKLGVGASTCMVVHSLAMLYLRKDTSQAAFLITCLASAAFKQNYLPKNFEKPFDFVVSILHPASLIMSGKKFSMLLGFFALAMKANGK